MKTATRLTRGLKLAALALGLGSLAACATPFKADVSRFESRLPAPQGQSFAVVAEDPANAGGLEFALYADYVENAMRELGYTQAASPEAASLLVSFDYGVDNGRERVRSTGGFGGDPFYSPWYGYGGLGYGRYRGLRGFGGWNYGWYDPFFNSYRGGFGGGGKQLHHLHQRHRPQDRQHGHRRAPVRRGCAGGFHLEPAAISGAQSGRGDVYRFPRQFG